jgi:phage gp29-like protein
MAKQNSTSNTITERPDKLIGKLIKANRTRARKMINDWTAANNQAGNAERPTRTLLYNLYEELTLDGDVHAEWETKRKLRLLANDWNLFDSNNKPNQEVTELLNKSWLVKLIGLAIDSKLYGHSLIEIDKINTDGTIASVDLVRRKHVIPEKGMVVMRVGDEKGMFYREDANAFQWLFEAGENEDLGLLNICAPYVLFMRFAIAAWSEFSEIFAMPLRVGKTQSKDTNSLNKMNDMLIEMATASFAVIDKEEEIEFIESNKTDGAVYNGLINLCTAKLAKILNGSVIGEASQGGSLAKEEVAKEIQEMVTVSDLVWVENWINDHVIPKLIVLGYPLNDLAFKFKKPKDLTKSLEIVKGLYASGFKPTLEWAQDEFEMPLVEITQPTPGPTNVKASGDFFA